MQVLWFITTLAALVAVGATLVVGLWLAATGWALFAVFAFIKGRAL
ncbi:hypothetical protein GTW51_10140 [Aurantimonas aggregata]|uniref:Uncharacterized protein n=1 Tax=Aurantimonas aggregata TaxID=2047720 RepID=A0A6L9MH92_9HYPH|nr:hypothetical protein [Aurantimonas aggregata]NDV87061.1 hypothetical protein [Aurantimonas aggregata]